VKWQTVATEQTVRHSGGGGAAGLAMHRINEVSMRRASDVAQTARFDRRGGLIPKGLLRHRLHYSALDFQFAI
jgi:hypothetical protein